MTCYHLSRPAPFWLISAQSSTQFLSGNIERRIHSSHLFHPVAARHHRRNKRAIGNIVRVFVVRVIALVIPLNIMLQPVRSGVILRKVLNLAVDQTMNPEPVQAAFRRTKE